MLLELFPLPRRLEKIPGALGFAFIVIAVLYYLKDRTQIGLALVILAALLLIVIYIFKARFRKEWELFIQDENNRLGMIKGSKGPDEYIPDQETRVAKLKNPDLLLNAKLNLASAHVANADGAKALNVIWTIEPEKIASPLQRLAYYTQAMIAYIMTDDSEMVDATYDFAVKTLDEVSEYTIVGFIPYEVQYRLYKKEYQMAFDQIASLPQLELDEASKDMLKAMKAKALYGLGKTADAKSLKAKLDTKDLLPSTAWLVKEIE